MYARAQPPLLTYSHMPTTHPPAPLQGLYQKWVQTQHRRVAAPGSLEESGGDGSSLAKRFERSQRHVSWKVKGAAPVKGGELKSTDQVGRGGRMADICGMCHCV